MSKLDKDVRSELVRLMEHFLQMEKETPEQSAKAWKMWKTKNMFEFLYGHWIGYFTGQFEGIIQERFGRDVTFDERNEIFEVVEEYAPKLREHLSYLEDK